MAQVPKPEPKQPAKSQPDPGDIELGHGVDILYPKMTEDPNLRWAFIRKVYTILFIQFLFTAAVIAIAVMVKPIPAFLLSDSTAAWVVYLLVLLSPFLAMWPMLVYRQKHPVNIIFLSIFTICISLSLGEFSAIVGGKIVLQSAVLTAVAMLGLTLYTFVAVRRGHDFLFLFPFLFCSLLMLLAYCLIQIFFPLGKLALTIYGCLGTMVFSACIIYDTNRLIKRHNYNEYITAAISLYLDAVNFFMSFATCSFAS